MSHSLFTVKAFCTRGVWINDGVVQTHGDLGPVILEYEDFLKRERAKQRSKLREEADDSENSMPMEKTDILETSGFRMFNSAGETTRHFQFGEDIFFEFDYHVKRPIDRLTFCYTVRNAEELEVYMADKQSAHNVISSEVGDHHLPVRLKNPTLLTGEYLLSGELWNNDAGFYVGHSNKRPFKVRKTSSSAPESRTSTTSSPTTDSPPAEDSMRTADPEGPAVSHAVERPTGLEPATVSLEG